MVAGTMDKGYGSGEQSHPPGYAGGQRGTGSSWGGGGHGVRGSILWNVREKGAKADRCDSVDGPERGTDLFEDFGPIQYQRH